MGGVSGAIQPDFSNISNFFQKRKMKMLRCFPQSELDRCGGILLPHKFWSIGTQLTHPEHGKGKLAFRDDEGRLIFEFNDQHPNPE